MQENKLGYSRKEAAAASSLSVRTVDYLIREGRLRALKIRGRVVIPAQALQKLLKAEGSLKDDSKQASVRTGEKMPWETA